MLFLGKFAEPLTSNIHSSDGHVNQKKSGKVIASRATKLNEDHRQASNSSTSATSKNIPPIPPVRKKKLLKEETMMPMHDKQATSTTRPKYVRSQTFIEPRITKIQKQQHQQILSIPRSPAGLPLVTGEQRHALTLLRMTDLFSYGINGTLRPCTTAKRVCHLLIDFANMITAAKRKLLEQKENFYKSVIQEDGGRKQIPMSRNQQRSARKKIIEGETFPSLPGKLDHASCVAWRVPMVGQQPTLLSVHADFNYKETDF